jgi:putative two-component system response regulator
VTAKERPVILCVDDSQELLALIARALAAEYEVLTAHNGGEAIAKVLGEPRPDLILLDVDMPQISGFELCRKLKSDARSASIPIIFLTSHTEAQSQLEGLSLGAVDYLGKSTNGALLKARVRAHVALGNQRLELERLVRSRTEELDRTRTELIRRLARALEFHESSAVGNRVMRLSHYAKLISQAAGAKPEVAEMMMKAAPLHDIGKLGVPAEILRKAGKLSEPDWERVKRHPQIGAEIIGEHDEPLLKLARILALTHHECWDGSGYPQGLRGKDIPWAGRIMAIVDGFESLTTTQFFRAALSVEKAAAEIIKHRGTKYDPVLIEAFERALPVMKKVRETYSDQLGDLINLDFASDKAPEKTASAPRPVRKDDSAALARAAAKKYK